jgi:hypothetical protein
MLRDLCFVIAGVLAVFSLACGSELDETEQPAASSESVALTTSEYWRLIITRAGGQKEIVPSAYPPQICGTRQNPRVLLFCGRIPGETPGPFWDFLPVHVDAGDTYTIETPASLTPGPTPTTATPTVVSP